MKDDQIQDGLDQKNIIETLSNTKTVRVLAQIAQILGLEEIDIEAIFFKVVGLEQTLKHLTKAEIAVEHCAKKHFNNTKQKLEQLIQMLEEWNLKETQLTPENLFKQVDELKQQKHLDWSDVDDSFWRALKETAELQTKLHKLETDEKEIDIKLSCFANLPPDYEKVSLLIKEKKESLFLK